MNILEVQGSEKSVKSRSHVLSKVLMRLNRLALGVLHQGFFMYKLLDYIRSPDLFSHTLKCY